MIAMRVEQLTPAQLAMLLPTQREIRELMVMCGCEGDEVDEKLERAIHRILAEIVVVPSNPDLWIELARAFGLHQMLKWKLLHVAHSLQPSNLGIMEEIAWACYLMGDEDEGMRLMDEIAACASDENDRAMWLDCLYNMKNPDAMDGVPMVRM